MIEVIYSITQYYTIMSDIIQKLELILTMSAIILIMLIIIMFIKRIFFPTSDLTEKSKNDKKSETSTLLSPSTKYHLDIGAETSKLSNEKKLQRVDTESLITNFDLNILEPSVIGSFTDEYKNNLIDEDLEAPSLDDDDDGDHYKMYIKYKRKCIDFQKSNNLLKKEVIRMKKNIGESDTKKETMKDLIRKLHLKLKQKNSKISELEDKTMVVDRDKMLIQELSSTVSDLRNKLDHIESSQAHLDVIIKIKSMYRAIRTMFLSSMRFNDEISMDNPVCQDIEHNDPIKTLSYIEKMLLIIIKNSKSDNKYDDNCSVETYKHNKNQKEYARVVSDNNDLTNIGVNTESSIICNKCDDMKSRLKKLVKTVKVLQKEVTKSQKTESFVNNIECLLSMYNDDKNATVRNTGDPKLKYDSILKSVGNCFKKWCECKNTIGVLTSKIDDLLLFEVTHKDLQKRFEDSVRENRDFESKIQIFDRWKHQIISILKGVHSEEWDIICVDSDKDDETTLIKITNRIRQCVDDLKNGVMVPALPSPDNRLSCGLSCGLSSGLSCGLSTNSVALMEIICMYKTMVDELKSDIGTSTSCVSLEDLDLDQAIIANDSDNYDQETIDKYIYVTKSKITELFMSVRRSYIALSHIHEPMTSIIRCLEKILENNKCVKQHIHDLSDPPNHNTPDDHTPLQFNMYVETILYQLNDVSSVLESMNKRSSVCVNQGSSESDSPTIVNTGQQNASVETICELEYCKHKLEIYQDELCDKEGFVKGLMAFLQKYLEMDIDKHCIDSCFIDKLFLEITRLSKTVDLNLLIDIIKTDHIFNEELINNCAEKHEQSEDRLLEIIDQRYKKEPMCDPMFDDYTKKVDDLMSKYLDIESKVFATLVPKAMNHYHTHEFDQDHYQEKCDILDDIDSDIKNCTAMKRTLEKKIHNILKCNDDICEVHKKYNQMLKILNQYQEKNIDILIKVSRLESNVKYLSKQKKNSNCGEHYLPEYTIYFECRGYPSCIKDYLAIDIKEIEKIRQNLEEIEPDE
jgi:hypothetical protein